MGYTKEGLKKLGEIIRQSRGRMTYREFEEYLGGEPSHATIRRLEIADVKNPDRETLAKIAPATPYCVEELQAIASEAELGDVRQYRTCKDVLPMVLELPPSELAKLGQAIFAKLGGLQQSNGCRRNG